MNDLEKAILRYLETRDDNGWKWIMGSKVYDKRQTIEMFKKDRQFRKFVCDEVIKLATDLFMRAAEEKKG